MPMDASKVRRGMTRRHRQAVGLAAAGLLAVAWLGFAPSAFADAPLSPPPGARDRVATLPIVEVPAQGSADQPFVALLLTGDGGYGIFDRKVSRQLAANGIPVVAVNSLRYFWRRRDPDAVARDMEGILNRYCDAWGKERVILIGHSLGADVMPFIVSRLAPEALGRIDTIALLGPALSVDFKFHLSYWLRGGKVRYPMSVEDEVQKLDGSKILCVRGDREKHSLCTAADNEGMVVESVHGGHAFRKHHEVIGDMILDRVFGGAAGPTERAGGS